MSKSIPTVQKYMTTVPETISSSSSLVDANLKMKELNVRHFPVTTEGKLTGILSDRDVRTALSLKDADATKLTVQDVCTTDPYQVTPDIGLDLVAKEMADKHYGAVVITQNDEVVGILTTSDICRVLAEILEQRFHH